MYQKFSFTRFWALRGYPSALAQGKGNAEHAYERDTACGVLKFSLYLLIALSCVTQADELLYCSIIEQRTAEAQAAHDAVQADVAAQPATRQSTAADVVTLRQLMMHLNASGPSVNARCPSSAKRAQRK